MASTIYLIIPILAGYLLAGLVVAAAAWRRVAGRRNDGTGTPQRGQQMRRDLA